MSQLQSVLRRSVAHLEPSDHDGRERMFANAREAMIRLLWSYDPPLSPSEIDSKIDEFDDIVAAILGEAEDAPAAQDGGEDDEDEPELPLLASFEPADIAVQLAAAATAEPEPEPEPKPEPAALPDRRAEALAILRRPARFEPLPQIGSPTPATSADKAESALKAKKAVEEALARLNGRLAPVTDDEPSETPADEEPIELEDEIEAASPIKEDDADETDTDPDLYDSWIEDAEKQSDDAPQDEPEDEREGEPDDQTSTDVERLERLGERLAEVRPLGTRFDDDLADEDELRDDSAEDDEDEDEASGDEPRRLATVGPAGRRFDEPSADDDLADDELPDRELADDEGYDDEPARRGLGERFGDAIGQLSGRRIAAIAAVVLVLAGGVLGGAYFLVRGPAPQVAVVEPAPPVRAADPAAPAPPAAVAPAATPPPATTQPPEIASGALALESISLFDGRDPSVFQSSPDNPVRFEGDTLGGFARISSSSNSTGSRITVGRGVFERLAGRTVRIVVVARAAADNPANTLRFAYQNGRALSPWQDGDLTADYAPLSLVWTVPKERGGPETDAVMLEPGIPGDGTAADVSSVRIEILK
ncbi:hypothetical protein [Kaistia granuli]|uniref:hypothetical protein n=1 Tax=Kaistia granuli TaxID=363259 RepID=UPI000362C485|nr:hypothetical protein [Kaistia granuli]